MNKQLRILSPLLVLLASGVVAWLILVNRPEPARKPPSEIPVSVETTVLEPRSYSIRIRSRGVVRSRQETTLVAQVAGIVREASPRFEVGERFSKGEWLVRIDPRDYRIAVTLARSRLVQARSRLAEEQARVEQARRDWERLGEAGTPSELALRLPQLRAEQAAVAAAEAELEKARLDLERTHIRAPFSGELVEKRATLGQYVAPGTAVARIRDTKHLEIRLPLTSHQFPFLSSIASKPRVTLTWKEGSEERSWPAHIARTEGAVDPQTQQRFVVAELEQSGAGKPPAAGQFVEAVIEGRRLDGVLVIPNGAIRTGNTVFVVNERGVLHHRDLEVIWRDEQHTVARAGLEPGDRLVTSPVGSGLLGRRVVIAGGTP